VILKEMVGIAVKTDSVVGANLNDFINPEIGIDNLDGGAVNAGLNWWGCAGGPPAPGCAAISGVNISYLPILNKPF
jgi:hypothetical protein